MPKEPKKRSHLLTDGEAILLVLLSVVMVVVNGVWTYGSYPGWLYAVNDAYICGLVCWVLTDLDRRQ